MTRNETFEIGTDVDSPVSLANSAQAPFAGNAAIDAAVKKDLKKQKKPTPIHDKARPS